MLAEPSNIRLWMLVVLADSATDVTAPHSDLRIFMTPVAGQPVSGVILGNYSGKKGCVIAFDCRLPWSKLNAAAGVIVPAVAVCLYDHGAHIYTYILAFLQMSHSSAIKQ